MRSLSRIHKPYEVCMSSNAYVIENVPVEKFCTPHTKVSEKNADKASADLEEIYAEAKRRADEIVESAKREAGAIIENAKREALAASNEIKRSAFNAAYEEGKREGLKQVEGLIAESREIVSEILEEKYRLLSDMEPEIVRFCLKVAEKIINRRIEVDEESFLSLLKHALKKAEGAERVTICVGAEHYDDLCKAKKQLLAQAKTIKNMDIVKNEFLKSSDCLIETDRGTIDASVASQIVAIEEAYGLKKTAI